jgi:hypothetical protein
MQDFALHTHQRFWEMYLAAALLAAGHSIEAPKPGPDIGLIHRGKRIWIEAVTATPGDPSKPDSVPAYEPRLGVSTVRSVPQDQITLRCTAAIAAKFPVQYRRHAEMGIVRPEDCYIVAVNIGQADYWMDHGTPPYVLRAVLGLNHLFVTIDRESRRITRRGVQLRAQIPKKQGDAVDADLFLTEKSAPVSGVISSLVNVSTPANVPDADIRLRQDFMLVTCSPRLVRDRLRVCG